MAIIQIESEEQWHALRAKHIGGSEIGTLFGESNYVTQFTLWHRKKGNVEEPRFINDRAEWGKRLEGAIAAGVASDMRWNIEASRHYYSRDDVKGMGCTLDYNIIDHANGPGIAEIKFVTAYANWKDNWSDTRAPVDIELQLQHQLACTQRPWGNIVCFIGQTATPVIYERKRNDKVIAEIERRIGAFWASIEANQEPDASGTADEWKTLRELYPAIAKKKVITIPDEAVSEQAQLFLFGGAQQSSGKKIYDQAKTKLLAELGDAETAIVPGYIINQRPHGAKGRVVTVTEKETGVTHTALTDTVELA